MLLLILPNYLKTNNYLEDHHHGKYFPRSFTRVFYHYYRDFFLLRGPPGANPTGPPGANATGPPPGKVIFKLSIRQLSLAFFFI